MLARRSLFVLCVFASAFAVGCSDTKVDQKPPAGTDLKPLPSPGAPSGAEPAKVSKGKVEAKPGGSAGVQ